MCASDNIRTMAVMSIHSSRTINSDCTTGDVYNTSLLMTQCRPKMITPWAVTTTKKIHSITAMYVRLSPKMNNPSSQQSPRTGDRMRTVLSASLWSWEYNRYNRAITECTAFCCLFCNAHCVGVSVKPDDSHCNIHFLVSLLLLLDHNSHSNQQNNTIDLKQETFTAIIRIYTCHCVHQS